MRKLLLILLLGFSQISFAETATDRATLYFNDLKSYKFAQAATHFDPAQLKEFRSLMGFYKNIPASAQSQFINTFFGAGQTAISVEAMSDIDFFAAVFKFIMRQAQASGGLNFDKLEILGEVSEGSNIAHLVTRNRVSVGKIETEAMEVVSLKKNNGKWNILLSGKIKGLPEQLKAAFNRRS